MLDFFSIRKTIPIVKPYLDKIMNLIDFSKLFFISNNQLKLRTDSHRIVVICYPFIRYSSTDKAKLLQYCHHQLIRYSNWDVNDLNEIRNLNIVEDRWKDFLKNA